MEIFKDKVAVITGAGGGIGAALARLAAAKDMFVYLADVNLDDARQVAGSIGTDRAFPVHVDVADLGSIERLADSIDERFDGADLVCNNAGIVPGGRHRPVWEYAPEDWRWAFDVNVLGVANGMRAFVPRMIARGTQAHILNTASVSGFISGAGSAVYGATKHAVVRITEALLAGLAEIDAPIGVTMLCPGLVNTRIFEAERSRPAHLHGKNGAPEELDSLASIAAMGADPAEVAQCAFDAIAANRFYAFTTDTFDAEIATRFQGILQRRNPSFTSFQAMSEKDADMTCES